MYSATQPREKENYGEKKKEWKERKSPRVEQQLTIVEMQLLTFMSTFPMGHSKIVW